MYGTALTLRTPNSAAASPRTWLASGCCGSVIIVPPRRKIPAFLARNGRDGRPEPLHVVERDVGDDRNQRLHDVRRIQPAAHAHFQHRNIHLAFGKIEKRLRRQDLKVAGKLRQTGPPALAPAPRRARENRAAQNLRPRSLRGLPECAHWASRGAARCKALCAALPPSGSMQAWKQSSLFRWFPRSALTESCSCGSPSARSSVRTSSSANLRRGCPLLGV